MNNKLLWVVAFFLLSCFNIVNAADKASSNNIEIRLYDLEHKVKIIDKNQLNYRIEKDLLKETYSNNYEKINIFITFILGFVAILGYLGIRDIGTIKEKYEIELSNIKELKNQFDLKSNEFDIDKKKIDDELRTLINENQEQNKKIKFIELKDRMLSLFKEKQLSSALEFANAALDIEFSDAVCLNTKGSILTRLNQMPDAINAFSKSLKYNPDDPTTKFNYAECLYFSGKINEANEIINNNKDIFNEKHNGELLEFFEIINAYHESDIEKLKEAAKGYVQFENLDSKVKKLGNWNLTDAQIFAHCLDDGELKTAIQCIIWYWDNKITGRQLLTKLGMPLPVAS